MPPATLPRTPLTRSRQSLVTWLLFAAVLATGCRRAAHDLYTLDPLPRRAIVFSLDADQLGFIHPDGRGLEVRRLPGTLGGPPAWTADELAVVGTLARGDGSDCCTGEPYRLDSAGVLTTCPQVPLALPDFRPWSATGARLLLAEGPFDRSRLVWLDLPACTSGRVVTESPASGSYQQGIFSARSWLAVAGDGLPPVSSRAIQVFNPAGEPVVQYYGSLPAWSPDGDWLAYSFGGSGIYLRRPDGSQRRMLTNALVRSALAWSPDGQWIVYDRQRAQGCDLYKLFVATGEEFLLFPGGCGPDWRRLPAPEPNGS